MQPTIESEMARKIRGRTYGVRVDYGGPRIGWEASLTIDGKRSDGEWPETCYGWVQALPHGGRVFLTAVSEGAAYIWDAPDWEYAPLDDDRLSMDEVNRVIVEHWMAHDSEMGFMDGDLRELLLHALLRAQRRTCMTPPKDPDFHDAKRTEQVMEMT